VNGDMLTGLPYKDGGSMNRQDADALSSGKHIIEFDLQTRCLALMP